MASTWVGSRDATQIRTHVQKFKKDKIVHWVAKAKTLKDKRAFRSPSKKDSESEGDQAIPCDLPKQDQTFLKQRLEEYMQMIAYAFEQQQTGANSEIYD